MSSTSHGRFPHAGREPILSLDHALAIFDVQLHRPLRAETLAMFLDHHHHGSTLVTVTDTVLAKQLLEVAEVMALAGSARPEMSGLVLASVRPGHGLQSGDDELWTRASNVTEANGMILIDWFVISPHGTCSPRELIGLPSRWPQ